jgi:hypothetical protein
VTKGTICKLAVENGADLEELFEEFFDPIEDIHGVADVVAQIIAQAQSDAASEREEHAWAKFSLRGMSAQFEAEMQEQVAILGDIALLGQWSVIYARPNAGKTLITLRLIIDGITSGVIDPEHLFYINADDNHQGLTAKVRLAERHGFNMLAPGYQEFRARDFLGLLRQLCRRGQAKRTIVVLDTLKKFTELMDKRTASEFGNAIREFIAKGGTLIGLAHVNKKCDPEGKPIYAGTSDIVDDADCVYIMDTISDDSDIRTVEFENIKSRGMVAKRAAYQYSTAEGQGYLDLLESVTPVDDTKAGALREAAERLDDRDLPLVQAITDCITGGITGKTKIIDKAASVTGDSKRHAERVLERHTGTEPNLHYWNFTIGDRGVNTFALLPTPDDVPDTEEL